MIEIGRRGFITGLLTLVAAPAVIRVAPIMPISVRHAPLYVPINWLTDEALLDMKYLVRLKAHAWPKPLADNWVDLNDHDPGFVREWVRRQELDETAEYWLS